MSAFLPWLIRRAPGWMAISVIAVVLAGIAIAEAGLGSAEWMSPSAFLLLPFVLMLPLQPLFTGTNKLAVGKVPRAPWSVRGLFAWLPDVVKLTGYILAIFALARPVHTHKDTVVESPGLDIMLAIDTSGSMQQEDMATGSGYASRIAVAKAVAEQFVGSDERVYDRIGVVVFGEDAFTWVPLTLDHDALLSVFDQVDIGAAGPRGTAVGTAIAVAAKRMKDLPAPERVVILLTDGRSNAGRLSPHEAAQIAAALHIKLYTIGVGASGGAFDDGIDEPMMRDIANLTGGRYFRASSLNALQQVYAQINQLSPTPAKVHDVIRHDELYPRILWPALGFVAFAALLSATVLRRGP